VGAKTFSQQVSHSKKREEKSEYYNLLSDNYGKNEDLKLFDNKFIKIIKITVYRKKIANILLVTMNFMQSFC